MAYDFQVVIDCVDPHAQAEFWAQALGYVVEDNTALVQQLLDSGQVTPDEVVSVGERLAFRIAQAVRDPEGRRPRVLLQVVPEGKTAKNRVHLDIRVGPDGQAEAVERLTKLGARKLWDGHQGGHSWVTMADPEGNEFCVA